MDGRDDELSRSSNGIIESGQCNYTENLQSGVTTEVRTRTVNTAVCPANHLAITVNKPAKVIFMENNSACYLLLHSWKP